MLTLRSLLPHLGLFLCLALHLSPSLSASDYGSCVVFDEIHDSDNLGINTMANVSGGNVIYTGMSKALIPLPLCSRWSVNQALPTFRMCVWTGWKVGSRD